MTNVGYATLSVIPSFNGFQGRLERGVAPGMAASGKNAGKRFGGAFGSALRGTLAGLSIWRAGSEALQFIGDSVAEGRESVRIGKQTAAVIKSTGGAARVSEKQAGRLANTLKRLSGVDDELIQGSENVLLTFKNIRNEQGENNKIFDKATKASLNLSKALGKDLNSSSLMVGKALNDPVAGMTALGRAGVQFTADQKDAIKKLVETGDTLDAQKVILRELNSEFKGSARAQRTEADRLSTAWGDFKEQIGKQLIPVLDDLATFLRKKGIPRAREFFGWIRDEGVPAAKDIAKFAGRAGGRVKELVDAFNGMPDWVKKVLIGGGVTAVAAKKLGAFKFGADFLLKRGNTPGNPLYVLDIGGGEVDKLPKSALAAFAKGGLLAAFGIESVVATKVDIKNMTEGIKGAIREGGSRGTLGGKPNGVVTPLFGGVGIGADKEAFKQQHAQLKETYRLWVTNKQAVEEYGGSISERIPKTIPVKVVGWADAQRQADAYYNKLIVIRNTRITAPFDNIDPGAVPNHSPSRGGGDKGGGGGGTTPRVIAVNNTYNVNTIGDAQKFDLHKRQQAGMGGFG